MSKTIQIKVRVFDEEGRPIYENSHEFDSPVPTVETELYNYYQFGFNFAEAKDAIYLMKPKIESEKIPEGKNREKAGEFSTKINQDLGILGE